MRRMKHIKITTFYIFYCDGKDVYISIANNIFVLLNENN